MSPARAALSQRMQSHEPQRHKPNTRSVSAAPTELNPRLSTCTQGSISGFALITPWAMKMCRPKGLFCDKVKINISACTHCRKYAYLPK